MKVVVAQKGAREHFLAARALNRHGVLACLIVDWYAPRGWIAKTLGEWISRFLGARGRAAMAAKAADIPDKLVLVNWMDGLIGKWWQRMSRFSTSSYDRALRADIAFTKAITRTRLPDHDVFFGYSYMSLEMLELEKRDGVLTILDQIDPGPLEFRLVAEEMSKHPELAGPPPAYPAAYYKRLRQEWDLADVIVVNSQWSREALISEGVAPDKIEILPLSYEGDEGTSDHVSSSLNSTASDRRLLKILWLGQVNVRKGIHYLMEAARLLQEENIHFDVVGPISIAHKVVESAPFNMTFHGSVSRDRAEEWYRQADVFILPTLSDGFALTQLEALAHGIPLITTPHCGTVVEEGKNGFMVPARDSRALANAILRFARTPSLAGVMRSACLNAVKDYSINAYGDRLMKIIQRCSSRLGT